MDPIGTIASLVGQFVDFLRHLAPAGLGLLLSRSASSGRSASWSPGTADPGVLCSP
jgi:hypothetical protein